MNGKGLGTILAGVIWVVGCIVPVGGWGATTLTELATPFDDPLRTVPKTLEQGAVLPGDGLPASCPVVKDFSTPLRLSEAVDLALCNNAQVKAAWAAIKVQAAASGVARAAYLPTLSGSASYREDKTRYPGSTIKSTTIDSKPLNGGLTWRLLDFGGRGANVEAAELVLSAALANHDAALQKTLAQVVQAYFDAQVAKAAWRAKEENEGIARDTLEAARRREAKGAGAASDTLQAATAQARAALEKNRAQGALRKALSVLTYEMGVPAKTPVLLAEDLDEPNRRAAEDLTAWLHEAEERHPAIVAARAQYASARQRVIATRSEGLPTLDFSANYYENGRLEQTPTSTRTQEYVAGITLTFPLFDGFSRTYKVRGAEAQVEQKEAELKDTEHQILVELVKAHADAGAALDNLAASGNLFTLAQAALQAVQRKYEKGAADILELLNTQAALSEARQERLRGLAEWRSARLRLLASAGRMHRGAVQE